MKVERLQKILEKLSPSAEVCIEYMPRPHEYVTEPVAGVRIARENFKDDQVIFFSVEDDSE